jgi:hypothetical protein
MGNRRLAVFVAITAVCVLVAGGYVTSAALTGGEASRTSGQTSGVATDGGLVFRSRDRANPSVNGRMVSVSLTTPGARPASTGLRCERVYFAAARGLCLAPKGRLLLSFSAQVLGSRGEIRREIRLAGFPSRARISPDGRVGAVTTFVTGHSYAIAGAFSTTTLQIDMLKGTTLADLERFRVLRDGRPFTSRDFNFWGVTFARDSNRFYATLASGGTTYLVRGDIRARTAIVLRENVECPSLSPDQTRIGYKKLVHKPGGWRLHVLDLTTGTDTALTETRSVDDQVEWRDDHSVLYEVGGDVWQAQADGRGTPRILIRDAESPAVVR